MSEALEVTQGLQHQGSDERIIYNITTTNWASSPTGPSVKAYDETASFADVTDTVFPANSPSVATDTITLSLLRELQAGHIYRIEVQFTVSTNIYECYFRVKCDS